MRSGKIVNLSPKGFGFVREAQPSATSGRLDYFFHSSDTGGRWASLREGDLVEFEPFTRDEKLRAKIISVIGAAPQAIPAPERQARKRTTKKAGPYRGETLELSAESRTAALKEISKWKLEARLDDIRRYFFAIPELSDVTTGDASYVIGRKGTGKTALVQYMATEKSKDVYATKLTFKNFPFNELYKQANDVYRRPNQYITIWKLIIYSSVCRLMSQSGVIDPLLKKTIDKAFPVPSSDQLGTIIGQWISGDFGVTVLGTGVSANKWFQEKRQYTLQEKVENLEGFVKKHLPFGTFLVLFDELDEDYKEMFEQYGKSEYLDLLTGLFKAVQDVRAVFSGSDKNLYPVVFLRDDIYDLIRDPDKNKWRDLEVDLEWTADGIRGLLAHRLSKALGATTEDFDVLWYSIFTRSSLTYSAGNKQIASFDFIKMSAQGRPRDYINYLQQCAYSSLKKGETEISLDTIKESDKAYSNYLKKELIDEIHGIIPDIAKVLSIFSELRKWILTIDEFKQAYAERVEAGGMAIADADMVLRTLFYFSVIGNVVKVDLHIFRHERPTAQLNFKERIVVHRGLMKSLQII